MNVRNLIKELLEYDMNLQVEIVVNDYELDEFTLDEVGIHQKYLNIKVNADGKTLVDDRDLEDLYDKADSIADLESRIKELEEENDSLQSRIDDI